ncbi:MAG: 23S rRNA (guanosine(2251)-2'-O)-methyltransferase RlmB [Hyphomicrobiaceae bacterium]|nr:23S rRNA (guanosine(2251)-2'-O)-methyltransferase RlmB [Hyphomicrobiaceae bacterium]
MSATSGKPGKSRFSAHPPSRRDRGRIKAAQPWREAPDNDGPLVLYGIHAVAAALANPARRISRLMATENAENRLGEAVAQRGLSVERVRPKDLDRLLGADTVHQGVAAEAEPLPEPELAQLVAASASGHGPLVVLDQVTDPHNVGAVLRSAAVFGAAGLVTTRRHSPPLNGTLAKAASGALEMVPVAMVQNLARTLDELKNAGVTVIGLDGEGDALLDDAPLQGAVAFVLGAEGKGLRQLTRETCSSVCRIGTAGTLASLNVSNAAAIALHLASMQRRRSDR